MARMRAVVLDGAGTASVADVAAPEPRAGELLVEVRLCGLCGSDVEKLRPGAGVAGRVLGHEVAGVVLDGPLPAGTRVSVAHHVPCGDCERCVSGHEPLCAMFAATDLRPGGLAERLVASRDHVAQTVLPLPDGVSDVAGALVEPLACVLRAVEQLPRGTGIVVGCGAIGQLFLRVLSARGDRLLAAEPDPGRLAAALALAERSPVPGDAADFAVVTAPAGLADALACLRPGGTVVLFAAGADPALVPLDAIYRSELRLVGVRSTTPRHLRAALAAIAGGLAVDDLVTDVLPLDRFAEGLARYRRGEALKVAFTP